MGFSRGFGGRDTPRTYAACQMLWEGRPSKKKDCVTLGNNTLLHFNEHRQEFYVTFHSNTIVTYRPEYKTIDACGYSDSPTTQDRISRLTGVTMRSNSLLGFHEIVRVNGWPYFAGMRIDNYGQVVEEDRRADKKTRPKKDVVARYVVLWKRIRKVILARWELGEFNLEDYVRRGSQRAKFALVEIEEFFAGGGTHIEYAVVMDLLYGGETLATARLDLPTLLAIRRNELRAGWYISRDGYETIEVK